MVDGWYLHFLQIPVDISRKQWFYACVHWRAGILDLCGAECGCMWLACDVTWWVTLFSRLWYVFWEIVSRRFMSMLAYLMWCIILRSSDMSNAWSQAVLWRTHPLIKLVVTVTFVMNKVEGSWARPWLKKNNFCLCQSQKCYVGLADMVRFQKLDILIDFDSIFRLLHWIRLMLDVIF